MNTSQELNTMLLSKNLDSIESIFKELNIMLLEKHFQGPKNAGSFEIVQKIVNTFGEPLLKLYLGMNLDFKKEITALWEKYYIEIFEAKLKVCKNPTANAADFDYDSFAVKEIILSAVSYFNDLGEKSKNGKDIRKEQTMLFADIFNYFIYYKEWNIPSLRSKLKPFIEEATKWLLRFLNGKLRVSSLSQLSQPEQEKIPQVFSKVFQENLSNCCDEAFDRINKNSQGNFVNDLADQDTRIVHYSVAELLLFFANAQAKEMPSGKYLKDTLINEPIQKKLTSYNISDSDRTFSELEKDLGETNKALFNDFCIAVLNSEKDCIEIFSVKETPTSIVSDAIFASLSLPDYFQKVVIRTKEAPEEILLISEQPQPYKFLTLVNDVNYLLPHGQSVVLGIDKNNIQSNDYFAIKYKGEPKHALDFDEQHKAENLATMSVSSRKITEETHLFYARWNDATQNYEIAGPTQKALNKKKWMENIMGSIGDKTLSQIMIPGSHDSGTNKMVCFFANGWAQCQARSFREQLDAGIRYFDCRLAYYPENKKDHFWFRHRDWNCRVNLKQLLDAVSSFLQENQKEIIILDFSHFRAPVGSKDLQNRFDFKEFEERFDFLKPSFVRDYQSKTIQDLVANNKRLVLLCDPYRIRTKPWGQSLNVSTEGWANESNIEGLKSFLEKRVQHLKDYRDAAGEPFHLTQVILTPTVSNIIPSLVKKVNEFMPEVLMQKTWLEKVNIMFYDYAGSNVFVDIAIYANAVVRAKK